MYALVRREGSLPGACVSQLVRLHVEIFRWRHVTPTRIGSAAWSTVSAASQPGAFVRTVVVCSAVAPLVFLTLAAAQSLQRSGPGSSAPDLRGGSSRGAEASVIFGAMLTVLGALNQVARHPRSSWTSHFSVATAALWSRDDVHGGWALCPSPEATCGALTSR